MARLKDFAAKKLMNDAKAEMQKGRESTVGELARSVERSWNYGEGKKTALKTAVGVEVALGGAAIGVATHGVGIPIIIGLAAGGLAVGAMSDTAFAKLWGRQYTGGQRTREWLGHVPVPDSFGQSKLLEERAHKTVRRAFQQYRTACAMVEPLKVLLRSAPQNCDQAFGMVTDMLRVKRHLDKARLYVHPAMFLLYHVLVCYDNAWKLWTGKDEEAAYGDWHPAKFCVIDHCYYTGAEPGGRKALPWIPGKFNVAHEKKLLEDLALDLKMDPTLQSPYPRAPYSGTKKLFDDAEREYKHRGLGVKIKHGITNPWERKTMGEQVAFVGKHGASVVLAGAGVGAHVRADEALGAIALLIDAGFNSADLGIEEGVEGMDPGLHPYTKDIESQLDGSKMGEGAQEGLRKAAIHLWETGNVMGRIQDVNGGLAFAGTTCDEALEYLRQVYKIQHHLLKTQKYLKEAIEVVTKLALKIDQDLSLLTQISNRVFDVIDPFMRTHKECEQCYCYRAAVHFSAT